MIEKPNYEETDEICVHYAGDQFGYFDKLIISGDVAHLFDYKFAVNEYAADSAQFWAYAVGLWNAKPEINEINVHVLHPFIDVIDCETWTRAADYGRLAAMVTAIVENAKRNDPATRQTGDQCQYCAVRGSCGKLLQIAEQVSAKFAPESLVIPDELLPENITDSEMLARGLKVAKVMSKWSSGVRAQALSQARLGNCPTGYTLGSRKAKYTITDPQMAWAVINENGYLTMDEFSRACSVAVGPIDTMIKEKAPRGQKTLMVKMVRDKLVEEGAARDEGSVDVLKKIGDKSEDED